ncbi:MAG: exosortase system-associated protein, TIGR04073 family [Candidatus Omnitrophica bacterium]|nr:exosortase system-associated protein, TIGR04073 family [Candidatus Omnitrophota bacterium]
MRKWRIASLAVVVMVTSSSPPAWAVGAEVDTAVGFTKKLARGVTNVLTGWVEIPKQMSVTWQEGGAGQGMTWGLVKGIGYAVTRTAVGAYETVTFPTPIPDGYQPIMSPEYVFTDFPGPGSSSHPSKG